MRVCVRGGGALTSRDMPTMRVGSLDRMTMGFSLVPSSKNAVASRSNRSKSSPCASLASSSLRAMPARGEGAVVSVSLCTSSSAHLHQDAIKADPHTAIDGTVWHREARKTTLACVHGPSRAMAAAAPAQGARRGPAGVRLFRVSGAEARTGEALTLAVNVAL